MVPHPTELDGKTIEKVQVWSDAVILKLGDGKTVAHVTLVDGALRLLVTSRGPEGAPPGVRVYPGEFPYPGELP